MVVSGLPAIREIGLLDFLFGTEWKSTAAEPKFGILPFILTSIWGTLGAIVIGVPMIIAGIVCGVLYSQMKTARLKTEANDYIGAGLKLRVQVDNYTHTDRVQVYDPPHEESSSSGGSSVDSDGFGGSSGGSF